MSNISTQDLSIQATSILKDNDRGGYTVPTKGLYPYQWNWDSAFAAWGFSTFDLPRAWQEFELLFSGQWADGMVAHIIFHQDDPGYFPGPSVWGTGHHPPTSGISQPPVAATLMLKVYEADPILGADRLKAFFPKLLAWHRWWHQNRCRSGVAAITHPWESGRDNCPDWDIGMAGVDGSNVKPYTRRDTGHVDPQMRPKKADYDRYVALVEFGRDCGWDQDIINERGAFLVADPAMTFILLRANRDLIKIARIVDQDTAEIEGWISMIEDALPEVWNSDLQCYDARDLRSGQFAGCFGSGTFLANYGGIDSDEMHKRLMRVWNETRYGIPSHDPSSKHFDPKRYWRGPTWPVVNSLIAMGFEDCGRTAEAERLRLETVDLIQAGGFFEYFDPIDGTPCGGDHFTWTAAIWLAWAGKSVGQ